MTGAISHPKALRRFMARQRVQERQLRRLNAEGGHVVAKACNIPTAFAVRVKPESAA